MKRSFCNSELPADNTFKCETVVGAPVVTKNMCAKYERDCISSNSNTISFILGATEKAHGCKRQRR
jgi:hypothetical protein